MSCIGTSELPSTGFSCNCGPRLFSCSFLPFPSDPLTMSQNEPKSPISRHLSRNLAVHPLTCGQILVITIRSIRTSLGVCRFGRSSASRGRVVGERPAPLQTQGATGRHYQGGQAPLLLPEARRKKACESCAGSQASPQEDTQRTGLTQEEPLLPGAALLNWPPTVLSCSRDLIIDISPGIYIDSL